MTTFLFIIYFLTVFLCFTTYFLYPIIIWLIGFIFPFKVRTNTIYPKVSIIISAFNEEKHIEKKILNTLALDYPKDKIEILIGSDGSTDGTDQKVKKYLKPGVQFFNFNHNRGKTSVQNDLVRSSKNEILIFTDAASFLPQDALKKIVRNFADERIGCVAGRMRFVDTSSNLTTQSQGVYWRYEIKLREMESQLGSLIGVDGPLYAVQRKCYVPLEPHIISDLMTPLLVLAKGKKVILEPQAIVDEEPTTQTKREFTTRRRITLRGLTGIASHYTLLNPLKRPLISSQILIHKILRWFVGILVAVNTIVCFLLLGNPVFRIFFIFYVLFFLAAGLGWATEKLGIKLKVLTIPYYFCLVNAAATMGIIDYFRRKKATTWQPVRDK